MISLKETLKEALKERQIEEGWKDTVKKGIGAAAFAGGMLSGQQLAKNSPPKAPVEKGFDFSKDKDFQNRENILAALRDVESAGGKLQNHQWIPNRKAQRRRKSCRAIRFHAFDNERFNFQKS